MTRTRATTLAVMMLLALLPLSGCAVITIAGAAAGAAISVTGAVVSSAVRVTGRVVEKTIDAVTPAAEVPAAARR